MAMTKKERAEFEALQHELRTMKAFAQPEPAAPERVMRAEPDGPRLVNGWDFRAYGGEVFPAWSESTRHGTGHRDPTATKYELGGSQGSRALYATKRDALIALRIAKAREFAEALARIDAEIEAEPQPPE